MPQSNSIMIDIWLVWIVDNETSYPELAIVLTKEDRLDEYVKGIEANIKNWSRNPNRKVVVEKRITDHEYGEEDMKLLRGSMTYAEALEKYRGKQ